MKLTPTLCAFVCALTSIAGANIDSIAVPPAEYDQTYHLMYGHESANWVQGARLKRGRNATLIVRFNKFRHRLSAKVQDLNYASGTIAALKDAVLTSSADSKEIAARTDYSEIRTLIQNAGNAVQTAKYDSPRTEKIRDLQTYYLNLIPASFQKNSLAECLTSLRERLNRIEGQWLEEETQRVEKARARVERAKKAVAGGQARTDLDEVNKTYEQAGQSLEQSTNLARQARIAAEDALASLWGLSQLEHLFEKVDFVPYGDDVQVSLTFTKIQASPVAGTGGSGSRMLRNPGPSPESTPGGTNIGQTDEVKEVKRAFGVDFEFFQSIKPSISLGFLMSSLRDESVRATAQTGGGFLLSRGASSGPTIKQVALVHLNVFRRNQFFTGPALGVTYSGSSNTGFFAGWGFQYGVRDRISLNLGWEFASVQRLDGLAFGGTSASESGLTRSVTRNRLALCFTYAFKL